MRLWVNGLGHAQKAQVILYYTTSFKCLSVDKAVWADATYWNYLLATLTAKEDIMAQVRPVIRVGDLVKKKQPFDDGKMYKVINVTAPKVDRCRLGLRRTAINTSEGFLVVVVQDKEYHTFTFRRRELWRVPNQPRNKKPVGLQPEQKAARFPGKWPDPH